jgi:hypothetical protein
VNFPGGTEKTHEKPQSGQPVSGPRFEPGTSLILIGSANHPTIGVLCLLQSVKTPKQHDNIRTYASLNGFRIQRCLGAQENAPRREDVWRSGGIVRAL